MTTYERDILRRNNNFRCVVCNNVCHATELGWNDPIVPSCPTCYTMDMMEELAPLPSLPSNESTPLPTDQ